MESTPLITTVLRIGGHGFNADELTALIGIEPTQVWQQTHERVKITHPHIDTIGWVYKQEKQPKWNLGEAIGCLLDVFWSKRHEIIDFVSRRSLVTVHPYTVNWRS